MKTVAWCDSLLFNKCFILGLDIFYMRVINWVKSFLKEIYKNSRILTIGWYIHLAIFIALIVLVPFWEVEHLWVNSLFKPLKFSISITIYLLTFAWILWFLDDKKHKKWFSITAVWVFIYEMLVIVPQALRWESSHFNQSSSFESWLAIIMWIAIGILTLYSLYILYLFFRQKDKHLSKLKALWIMTWILVSIAWSSLWWIMVENSSHAIWWKMWKEWLWFLNRSMLYGDIRVAHFLWLHALQTFPITAWILDKMTNKTLAHMVFWLFVCLYCSFIIIVLLQALNWNPFIAS